MTTRPMMILLAGALLGGAAANAQTFDVVLSDEQVAMLAPAATPHYADALAKIDRVDPGGALDAMSAAAAADPSSIELQFLVAKYARLRAEVTYGEETIRYYDMAEAALRRLLGNPRIGPEERARVRRESERIRQGKEGLRARDDARLKDGFKLVRQIHGQRLDTTGIQKMRAEIEELGIDTVLEKKETVEEEKLTREDIWIAYAAPGLAIVDDSLRAQAQQNPYAAFGAYGAAAGGFGDPFAAGGFDPAVGATGDPFGPGAPMSFDPAVGATGDPFGPGAPTGFDPGVAPMGDPFGAGSGGAPTPYGDFGGARGGK